MPVDIERFAGIPGTISGEIARCRWERVTGPESLNGRCYVSEVPDGFLRAMVTQDPVEVGKLLWHVSVSHVGKDKQPDRCPNWDELKHAVYRLIQVDRPFVLIFPRRSAPYVDAHPTTLHLWEATNDIDF